MNPIIVRRNHHLVVFPDAVVQPKPAHPFVDGCRNLPTVGDKRGAAGNEGGEYPSIYTFIMQS